MRRLATFETMIANPPVLACQLRRCSRRSVATMVLLAWAAFFALMPVANAQTTYAWSGAINNQWSTAGNWNPIGIPANGDSLVFNAAAGNRLMSNDLPAGRVIHTITFSSKNYVLTGNGIVLTSGIVDSSPNNAGFNQINFAVDVQSNSISLQGGSLILNGPIAGTGPISLVGPYVAGTNAYSGPITGLVQLLGGSFANATLSAQLGLAGSGTTGPVSVSGNLDPYTFAPIANTYNNAGLLNTGNLSLTGSSNASFHIEGASAGISYDQVNVTGTVALGTQRNLDLVLGNSFIPSLGQQFVLINNDGVDAIAGSFSGKPEGATVTLGAFEFQISYVGGTGNDVVLTCTFAPKAWNGSASNLWSNPNNWTPIGTPTSGTGLLFPDNATNRANVNDLAPGTAFSRIVFSGRNYLLTGNGIVLTSGMVDSSPNSAGFNQINFAVDVQSNSISLQGGSLILNGPIAGSGPISLVGPYVAGTNAYSGPITGLVQLLGGSFANATMSAQLGLGGSGTTGPASVGGNLNPYTYAPIANTYNNAGLLHTGNLSLALSAFATFHIEGATAGLSYDQVDVTGSVALGPQVGLLLNLGTSFIPSLGQQFVLINNDGSDAIVGAFSGQPEGATIALGGFEFQLSYVGGTGNDLVLTCTFAPKTWNGSASNVWSNPNNWTPIGTPASGAGLLFPDNAANRANVNDLSPGTVFSRIVFSGKNYLLTGNGIVLTSSIVDSSPNSAGFNQINLGLDVQSNSISLQGLSLIISGPISGTGPISSIGPFLGGSHPYSGTLTGFARLIGGSFVNATISAQSGLVGSGTTGLISVGGNLDPFTYIPASNSYNNSGLINTGNFSLVGTSNAMFHVEGTSAGISYDQINVTGSVALGTQGNLNVILGSSFVPALGQQYVLINNDGVDAITGSFSGRPEGATIALAGFNFQLSYAGGTGNDVTLTSLNGRPPSSSSLASTPNPSSFGQSVSFTATVAGAGATPTGLVSFRDGVVTLGTGTLNGSGIATFFTSALSVGNHSITAEFVGDANYGGSVSAALTQTVVPVFTLTYSAGAGGSISGTSPQQVPQGASGSAVNAVANIGYHFVNWSDGSIANPRTDTSVIGHLSVTANFAINTYTLTYAAAANGSLTGSTMQTINHGASGSAVSAVPDSGYHFVQWSDASTANPRIDSNVVAAQSLTAFFANAAPTISVVTDINLLEDSGTTQLTITVGDNESPVASLLVTASSSSPGLVADPTITAGATNGQRIVSFMPLPQLAGGPVTITLTVTDGGGNTAQRAFAITVQPVNDRPTLILGSVVPHPAATSGAQSQPAFASFDLGPDDEDAAQSIDAFLIDSIVDPDSVIVVNSLAIDNSGALAYTLTGTGGMATISVRVRDNGGVANGGINTSLAQAFTISVAPGADLQIAKTNHRSGLVDGESILYAIVVANLGPNAVSAATLTDTLPASLLNASWICVPAQSTALCPTPDTGTGNLDAAIELGVNQYLRFDVLAEVDGNEGAFVTNTATIAAPAGVTALNTGDDSATDTDPIVPLGIFINGFETPPPGLLTVPGAAQALKD